MPNQAATPTRTIRIPDALWGPARVTALMAGETLTAVVNRALEAYVANPPAAAETIGELACPTCKRVVRRRGGTGSHPSRHLNTDGEWCAA